MAEQRPTEIDLGMTQTGKGQRKIIKALSETSVVKSRKNIERDAAS